MLLLTDKADVSNEFEQFCTRGRWEEGLAEGAVAVDFGLGGDVGEVGVQVVAALVLRHAVQRVGDGVHRVN